MNHLVKVLALWSIISLIVFGIGYFTNNVYLILAGGISLTIYTIVEFISTGIFPFIEIIAFFVTYYFLSIEPWYISLFIGISIGHLINLPGTIIKLFVKVKV
ncbi:hypothetical protein [Persephonella sp.]